MPRKATPITLREGDYDYLRSLIKQRTIQAQVVIRAHILLDRYSGTPIRSIAKIYDISPATVQLCVKKYLNGGTESALFDDQRTGRPVEITDDAVAWIIDVACQRPADLGYSQELWTLKNLHQHIQAHAVEAGFPRLETITKPMVHKILHRSDIKPHKIKYYCERRDPDFESKMHDVLLVYKQVSLQFDEGGNIIIPAHKSKETLNYLVTRPDGRFVFVFTPKHGSWLNMIESFFSKMTKQMLKGIRVESKEELERRIYLYFEEINQESVVFHWTYKMDEVSIAEAIKAGVKSNEEICTS